MTTHRAGRVRYSTATEVAAGIGMLLAAVLSGCSPTEAGLPPEVQDPASFRTPAGAMARYRSALLMLPPLVEGIAFQTGVFTDELAALPLPPLLRGDVTGLDSRQVAAFGGVTSTTVSGSFAVSFADYYGTLHQLRGQAREARGFLLTYVPDSVTAQGQLYALEGYAEIYLADLYCSGIPLSTVDYGGDYTLTAGLKTVDVYRHAAALLDSALALSAGSAELRALAAVGRGRALLDAGLYAEAQAAVADVPTAYVYTVTSPAAEGPWHGIAHSYDASSAATGTGNGTASVADREGLNGFDYRSSHDPRIVVDSLGVDLGGNPMYFPAKYPTDGPATYVVASGVEARLIEAEAALQQGGEWLAALNALRTDGTFELLENGDTLWHQGTGGVDGLAPLSDPGLSGGLDATAQLNRRADLVFRERAFWLYLTGHRQGDLRRLMRAYARVADLVYPTGPYPGGSGSYGTNIVAPVPASERRLNPKYTGCVNFGA